MDQMAGIREEARKRGGDELVAKVDAAHARENALTTRLNEMISEEIAALPEGADVEDRGMAFTALTEALSAAYGRATVEFGKITKTSDGQLMVLAVRSIANSIQVAMADRDATDSGVAEMIKGLAKKGDK